MRYIQVNNSKWHIEKPLTGQSVIFERVRCGLWPMKVERFQGPHATGYSDVRPSDLCRTCERLHALDEAKAEKVGV